MPARLAKQIGRYETMRKRKRSKAALRMNDIAIGMAMGTMAPFIMAALEDYRKKPEIKKVGEKETKEFLEANK